ncbi:MAG: carboxypeptidase regulatory-like domain-containing protein [Acidobacteria bacterium]|nr:carboxypeptidase regulatory-like domain-containing protein [Acidobacteriota bacterium]
MTTKMLSIVIMTLSIQAYAQEYRGRVQGNVNDTSQAAMVNVKVTLRNVDTGLQETRATGETGHYLFDLVQPGSYTVRAESVGFSTTVQEKVLVQTRADVTVDLVMKPGAIAEVVTVTASPVSVPMNTSKLEVVVDHAMVNSIPTPNRNVYLVTQLEASVEKPHGYEETRPYDVYAAGGSPVAGGAPYTTEIQIDGAAVASGQKVAYTPPQDAVQEVTLQQNSVDAQNGNSGGSSITVSLKSGTNEFHGTAMYLGQYPWLNAIENRYTRSINRGRNRILGGSLGNPIVKNKLFNYATYEQWTLASPNERTYTMPTDLEVAGDFSQSLNKAGAMRLVYDPWSTVVSGNKSTRTPFGGNKLPASRMSNVAKTWASQLWRPNRQGVGLDRINNFVGSVPNQTSYKNFLDRADWYATDKLRVFGRYSWLEAPSTGGNPTESPLWVDNSGSLHAGTAHAANAVYTAGPRTIVNVSWERHTINDDAQYLGELGPASWAKLWPNSKWYQPLFAKGNPEVYQPRIQLNGVGANFLAGTNASIYRKDAVGSSFAAKVARDQGRHYLKVGVDTRVIDASGTTGQLPGFSFNSSPTVADYINTDGGMSGDAMATMLLGVVAPGGGSLTKIPILAQERPSSRSYSAYIQDDIKVNRWLTLNLGLRYEYEQPFVEADNRFSLGPDLNAPIPELKAAMGAIPAAVSQYYTGSWLPNGPWRFTDSNNRGEWNGGWGTLQPRLGAVVRLNDKTSLRAAWARYGIPWVSTQDFYLGQTDLYNSSGIYGLPGFSVTTFAPELIDGTPGMTLDNPFPATFPLLSPIGKSLGAFTMLGSNLYFYTADRPKPFSDRLNISLSRQLPMGMVVEGTFFYNRSRNTDSLGSYYWDRNLIDPRLAYQYKQAISATIANPFYNILTPEQFPGTLRNLRTVTLESLMRPYPQYGRVLQGQPAGSGDKYRSAQVRVQKAYSRGFSLLAGYNYHNIKQTEFYDSVAEYLRQFNWQDYAGSRHRFTMNGTWEMPFGKGRPFAANMPRVLDYIVGGWGLSGVLSWRSGDFLRFGPLLASGNPIIENPTADRWFDTSVFKIFPSFTQRTNPKQYPGLTGPGRRDVDARVTKSIAISERIRADLILDALNVFNNYTPAMPFVGNPNDSRFGKSVNQMGNTYGRRVQPSLRITF